MLLCHVISCSGYLRLSRGLVTRASRIHLLSVDFENKGSVANFISKLNNNEKDALVTALKNQVIVPGKPSADAPLPLNALGIGMSGSITRNILL